MRNKIFWLSLLGLALARSPKSPSVSPTAFREGQKQRSSRSIWPFTSSVSTTEAPPTYPPGELGNDWFLDAETALPQGIDLSKYPLWKIHKYHGIDLRPVKLEPENPHPPENLPIPGQDITQAAYQNGYQNFLNSKQAQNEISRYPEETFYPPEKTYPEETQNYQSGEFLSSDYRNPEDPQKYTLYAPAVEDDEVPVVPHTSYGVPENYQVDDIRDQPASGAGDLSFLDDLGGLADFLPEPEDTSATPQSGFFQNLLSKIRGPSQAPATAEVHVTEKPAQSGGFLSSLFGQRQEAEQPGTETVSGGSVLSSILYGKQPEKPAVVLPVTYYLPETKGSYVAVKVPAEDAKFSPDYKPYVSSIPIHSAPKVPFRPDEIPMISAPTLPLDHGYQLNDSDERTAGRHRIQATLRNPPKEQNFAGHSTGASRGPGNIAFSSIAQVSSERNEQPEPIRHSGAYEIHIDGTKDQQTFHNVHQSNLFPMNIKTNSMAPVRQPNVDGQVSSLSLEYQLPKNTRPVGLAGPLYHTSASVLQKPENPPQPTANFKNLPVHEAVDFRKPPTFVKDTQEQGKSGQSTAALTSYGTPLASPYDLEPFVASPSDMTEVIVPSTLEKVLEKDAGRFSNHKMTPQSQEANEEEDHQGDLDGQVRKDLKEQTISRRSSPERQAPTLDTESAVFRSEKALIPDVIEGHHYDDSEVVHGYSKVTHSA